MAGSALISEESLSDLLRLEDGRAAKVDDFEQHSDPDVVIPFNIARPLLYSSHLMLITSIVSIVCKVYGIAIVTFIVYVTSVLHWRAPRYSTMARKLDYVAVIAALIYASYYSTTVATKYSIAWFVGISIIGVIFATNETFFYRQTLRIPTGQRSGEGEEEYINVGTIFCCESTQPNTAQRDWVYRRTVYVHLMCVHVFANALALTLVIDTAESEK